MSVQFGRWSFDGKPFTGEELDRVDAMLAPYGPDGKSCYSGTGISILFRPFHTTTESLRETQPHWNRSGSLFTWDGCLDNRAELIGELGRGLTAGSSDIQIAAKAYERWGPRSFAKLIGDWCFSVWNPQTLILAKDAIGPRRLFYLVERSRITWSTILDPLVLLAGRTFPLCEEYIAGAYFLFPAAHLTPFAGILSVPPACFVRLTRQGQEVRRFWDFDPEKRIRYRTDVEYEDHFRFLLAEAVRRKLRARTAVLAELSGGTDSSAIVCMADRVIAGGTADVPRLDTVSYHDESEPNWNEKPYFEAVERQRGRMGCHIDVGNQESFLPRPEDEFSATPFARRGSQSEASRQLEVYMKSQDNRVVLSGTGGDEVLGGVPDPVSEFQDLILTGRLGKLGHQLKLWALEKRKPWIHLFIESLRGFLPWRVLRLCSPIQSAAWLDERFVKRNRKTFAGYPSRTKLFGPLPAFQKNLLAIGCLQRQLACASLPHKPLYEKRYPLLDRDLLEFLCAVPRDQIVRPGQRRSLLRRSLAGIVPPEILERRRKAFLARAPMAALFSEWPALEGMAAHMLSGALGIVDPNSFTQTLLQARQGREIPMVWMLRTIAIEFWLRSMRDRRILPIPPYFASPCEPFERKHRARNALPTGQVFRRLEKNSGDGL